MLQRTKNVEKTSFFGSNSKSYTKHSKEKLKNYSSMEGRSKINVMSQLQEVNKSKFNTNELAKSPKSKNRQNQNNLITDNIKKDFSIKLIKKISNADKFSNENRHSKSKIIKTAN